MTALPRLVLASRSPRRAALLRQMGFRFDVIVEDIDENDADFKNPEKHVLLLSQKKAEAVLPRVSGGLIIGADTIVHIDGQILGKPADAEEAKKMLKQLSGKTHEVFTGFTLNHGGGNRYSDVERTTVTFRKLETWEIDDYVATGGPLDKAGGYGIQDRSGLFVDKIQGCFYNVVGFPLTKFYQGLKHLLDVKTLRTMINNGDPHFGDSVYE